MGRTVGLKILWVGMLLGGLSLQAASKSLIIDNRSDWASTGRLLYSQCEFKSAAKAFTKALQFRPEDADIHLWLGKSYARMAEVAGPLLATADARHARHSLERAVELEPRN